MPPGKKLFVFHPVGMDRFDRHDLTPRPGVVVRRTQPPGTPRNGTMGHSFVENAHTGEFHGLVLDNSLTPLEKADKGAGGWPLVAHPTYPGEKTIACPSCGSTRVSMTAQYPARGTVPGGRGRLGDPGAGQVNECHNCGNRHLYGRD